MLWQRLQLQFNVLNLALIDHVHTLAPALNAIVNQGEQTEFTFSARLLLSLANYRLNCLSRSSASSVYIAANALTHNRVWNEIIQSNQIYKSKLYEQLNSSPHSQHQHESTHSALSAHSTHTPYSQQREYIRLLYIDSHSNKINNTINTNVEQEYIAFTCNHTFTRKQYREICIYSLYIHLYLIVFFLLCCLLGRDFVESVLSEFVSRLISLSQQSLSLSFPVTIKFLLSEYGRAHTHTQLTQLACPHCIYTHINNVQSKRRH